MGINRYFTYVLETCFSQITTNSNSHRGQKQPNYNPSPLVSDQYLQGLLPASRINITVVTIDRHIILMRAVIV